MPESPERPEKHAAGGGGGGGEHMLNREHNPMMFAQIRSQTRSTKNATSPTTTATSEPKRTKIVHSTVVWGGARGGGRARQARTASNGADQQLPLVTAPF